MSKTWKILLIAIAVSSAIAIILYLTYFKSKLTIAKMSIQSVFNDIKQKYSLEIAQNVEKIYRLETAHFTSEIYNKTGGAGMLAFNTSYPWGWSEFSTFWANNPKYKPIGIFTTLNQSTQTNWNYLKFDNWGGFYTLAEFLKNHNNNPGRWYSLVAEDQETYNNNIGNIQVIYTA